ncbi:MAG TPA: TIGR03621 family F420-dependent LLM class oxidoreductase [Acidimicrobiales bacterium]|nr:TIGR03621 family F420-dependent LLM class oxidoreductase [Acidimicrobiales bacterium]
MRPFRFAVQVDGAPTGKAWRDLARKTEDLGYSTLFVPDHFGDQWAPIVALTVAAEATTTLRVGSLVFDNDYRHPLVLAKELASLDLASEGRLEAGIGAGWMKSDYDESGIAYDPPATRVQRFEEGVQVIKELLAEGSCTFKGKHYQLSGAQGHPRPHTPGGPPILIGGGSRRVLGIAGRHADIVGINPNLAAGYVGAETAAESVPAKFDQRVAWVRDGAGERFDQLELQCLTFFVQVGVEPKEMAANIAPMFGLDPEEALDIPLALAGSVDFICETLEARRQRWGFNYVVVHQPEMEAFAEVVSRLAGR